MDWLHLTLWGRIALASLIAAAVLINKGLGMWEDCEFPPERLEAMKREEIDREHHGRRPEMEPRRS